MSNLLTVIRAAMRPGSTDDALELIEGETGAQALNPEAPHSEASIPGGTMSGNQTVAGAASAATAITAAVAAASGGADGFKTATDRMQAILGADGIKGDGNRMAAALDLATAAPDMGENAVVAFVTANVPATMAQAAEPQPAAKPAASQPQPAAGAYEASVQAAASLAMPGGVSPQASAPKINRDAIFEARRTAQKGA